MLEPLQDHTCVCTVHIYNTGSLTVHKLFNTFRLFSQNVITKYSPNTNDEDFIYLHTYVYLLKNTSITVSNSHTELSLAGHFKLYD